MKSLTAVAVVAMGMLGMTAGSAFAAGSAEAGPGKAAVCVGCHGPDGNSPADMWPKLAGQLPEYITKQLRDFRSGKRTNEQMSPMAKPLSDQDIADLAAYFSKQAVKPAEAKKELLANGEKLYTKGKGRPDIIAGCIGCHGQTGGGKADWKETMKVPPTILAPAIGSQHPAYIAKQLAAYKSGARTNDEAGLMRQIASRMTNDEIAAVAEYAATLTR